MATITVITTVACFASMAALFGKAISDRRHFYGRIEDLCIQGNGWRLVNGEFEEEAR